jgi:hypothetical protein
MKKKQEEVAEKELVRLADCPLLNPNPEHMQQDLDKWMVDFNKIMNDSIPLPDGYSPPKTSSGHAFWKKEYNIIAAQLKHLKHAIDLLSHPSPQLHKANLILTQKCNLIVPPHVIALSSLPSLEQQPLNDLIKVLRVTRSQLAKTITFENRKRHNKVSTLEKQRLQDFSTTPSTLKKWFSLVSLKAKSLFPVQSTWVKEGLLDTLITSPQAVKNAADSFFRTIFDSKLQNPLNNEDFINRRWDKAIDFPEFMRTYLSKQLLPPSR